MLIYTFAPTIFFILVQISYTAVYADMVLPVALIALIIAVMTGKVLLQELISPALLETHSLL